ncbi:MAG TPA: hypothetical protein VNW90_29445, partial [Acetobacteraceae bacterium]|nr:hypothetical protein [Acetobacteraceae bacterium]
LAVHYCSNVETECNRFFYGGAASIASSARDQHFAVRSTSRSEVSGQRVDQPQAGEATLGFYS